MSFEVDPQAVRKYADELAAVRRAADTANAYVNKHGSFSTHESGLMGYISGAHADFVASLNTMLKHLMDLADSSEVALKQLAAKYEQTDESAAAKVDSTYPVVPRTSFKHD
ncbi:type VII secretion target [Actinoplanes friuliensis]|uniref:ESX-1 secretion-associated protein n=1 Tax=Actinoplanes friuliensis DSM 7358 TaxID=1246995 RepID=U5VTK2_9ACTN|nr:type VII secretion target [Actinoplanes friuliensis]AGZ40117.1 hypothetical protein AFR_09140 [Actinoplanes friuliensis DSM 7358]